MDISKTMSFTTRGERCVTCGMPNDKWPEMYWDDVCSTECFKLRSTPTILENNMGKQTDYHRYGFCGKKPVRDNLQNVYAEVFKRNKGK
jgi:hypothetical protein